MSKRTRSRLSIRKETLRRLDAGMLARVVGGLTYAGGSTTCGAAGGGSGGCATETLDCIRLPPLPGTQVEEPLPEGGADWNGTR